MAPTTPQTLDANDPIFNQGIGSLVNPDTSESENTFNVIRYPPDLASSEHPHYVMFYIQVRQSDLSKEEQTVDITPVQYDDSKINRHKLEDSSLNAAVNIATILAAATFGKTIGTAFGGELFGAAGKVAGTAVGATAAVAGVGDGISKERTKVLLKDVIALYLNGKPSAQYKASWADEELGLAGGGGEIFNKIAKDLDDTAIAVGNLDFKAAKNATGKMWDDVKGAGGSIAKYAILKGADKAKSDILGNFGAAIKSSVGLTTNPFKAQLFNTMGFRQFSFDYTFLPKNSAEYYQVQQIVKTFKKYMHPILDVDKFIMKYPAEWNIAYYYKGSENFELFKIANCALTDLKVEYGGTDFVTFKRLPGAPTEISLHIQFTELELLTRERIKQGF